jgi:hypothetical protein
MSLEKTELISWFREIRRKKYFCVQFHFFFGFGPSLVSIISFLVLVPLNRQLSIIFETSSLVCHITLSHVSGLRLKVRDEYQKNLHIHELFIKKKGRKPKPHKFKPKIKYRNHLSFCDFSRDVYLRES